MIRRVPHLVLVLLAVAALLAPSALAGAGKPKKHHKHAGSCTSAVCVYTEPNQTASGGYGGAGGPPVPLEAALARKLAKLGGSDAQALANIATSRAFGVTQLPKTSGGISVSAPGAFLAALDLGPGPIALFVTLLAGATAFGLGGALRRRRTGL